MFSDELPLDILRFVFQDFKVLTAPIEPSAQSLTPYHARALVPNTDIWGMTCMT